MENIKRASPPSYPPPKQLEIVGTAFLMQDPLLEPLPPQFTTASHPKFCQAPAERPRSYAMTAKELLRSSVLGACGASVHTQGLPSRPPCRVLVGPAPRTPGLRVRNASLTFTRSSLLTVGAAHGPGSRSTSTAATSSSPTSTSPLLSSSPLVLSLTPAHHPSHCIM